MQCIILPYATLNWEIELIEIKHTASTASNNIQIFKQYSKKSLTTWLQILCVLIHSFASPW